MKRSIIFILIASITMLSFAGSLSASTFEEDDTVNMIIDIDDDVYVYGNTVNISNNINGDLVVVGFRVNMNGNIGQDVLALGGSMDFGGYVKGDLRAIGGTVGVDCEVEEDVLAIGGFLDIDSRAKIGGDLVLKGKRVLVDGNIAGRIFASGSAIVICGTVEKDIIIDKVESLKITDSAVIRGDITYRSENEAEIEDGAKIEGSIKFEKD